MLLGVYSKDEGGAIRYLGRQDWDSRAQFWVEHFRDDDVPDIEQVRGWPDVRIEWRYGVGLAVDGGVQ